MNKFKFQADVIGELHPLFKGLQWVCAARSTDDDRPVLNLICVERDGLNVKIVATDGKRLHVHTFDPGMFDDDIDMIQPGLYEVVAKSGKLIVVADPEDTYSYPNWRQVMPDHNASIRDVVTASSIGKIGIRSGVLLATDFTLDAIGFKHGRGKDESVAISYGHGISKAGAFLIEHDLGTAVIMPLRMEDAEKGEVEATPFMDGIPKPEPKAPAKSAPEAGTPEFTDRLEKFIKDVTPKGGSVAIIANGETVYDSADDDEQDGPRIVDVEAPQIILGWDDGLLEDVLVDVIERPVCKRIEILDNIFGDGTADPFLKYLLADARPTALLKQQAMRAAIRGNDDLRDGLTCEGAKRTMRDLEKAGSMKAITAKAKELVALLVPKDLAEIDLILEGGSVLPLGVRNMIRKATDKALADAELEETQPEGGDEY